MFQRAIVIGCSGAGKSTFARRLRDITGLPLHHLDLLWHKPDRTTVTPEQFDRKLAELLREERWIIDGDYSRTMEWRMQRCDAVFLLDYPTEVCLAGVAARRGTLREDMPWVEEEPDPEFLRWIEEFPRRTMPLIRRLLEQYRTGRQVVVFRTREESEQYLRALAAGLNRPAPVAPP